MNIRLSNRLAGLSEYPFAEIGRRVRELKARGIEPIDFGAGDPTEPTPEIVRAAIKRLFYVRRHEFL